jgi:predicted TIM-barrel fold metal-dependent hydrolase
MVPEVVEFSKSHVVKSFPANGLRIPEEALRATGSGLRKPPEVLRLRERLRDGQDGCRYPVLTPSPSINAPTADPEKPEWRSHQRALQSIISRPTVSWAWRALQSPEFAVTELERCMKELGLHGVRFLYRRVDGTG